MARFPIIQRSCPLSAPERGRLSGSCHVCSKAVHDLSNLDDAGRVAFMADQNGAVCVSYRLRAPAGTAAVVAAMLGLGVAPADATAPLEGLPPVTQQGEGLIPVSPAVREVCADEVDDSEDLGDLEFILVGGIETGDEVQWFDSNALPGLTSIRAREGDELADWTSEGEVIPD